MSKNNRNSPNVDLKNKKESKRSKGESSSKGVWLYGYHPVVAALKNPDRNVSRLLLTKETAAELEVIIQLGNFPYEIISRAGFEPLLPKGAVHQGIAAQVSALPEFFAEDLPEKEKSLIVVLDQVTDPHNVGAILRSAAAFGADAVLMTERNAPETTGVLAKSASGALEVVPLATVTNLARTMQALKDKGYWCVGMDGRTDKTLQQTSLPNKIALIMGSEGYGLRRLTAENCDFMVKLPMSEKVESLNVSNAAAIALCDIYCRLF